MTFEELSEWTIALGAKEKLSPEVRQRVSRELPSFVRDIDPKTTPKRLKSPTGESLADATRMTAIKCHCLLLARKVHGSGFVKVASEYEALAKDLLFWVMRHNFNTGNRKGAQRARMRAAGEYMELTNSLRGAPETAPFCACSSEVLLPYLHHFSSSALRPRLLPMG
jgi:hypothetical protein